MKKYSVYLAILALVFASLACQTIMGGGDTFQPPEIEIPELPQTDNGNGIEVPEIEIPTLPPVITEDNDNGNSNANSNDNATTGGESEFPIISDAFNVITAPNTVAFQTKMSSDDVMKFYRDEFSSQGYTEDSSMAITFGKTFTLAFNGHASGKVIYVVGADAGDGSIYVTITLG